MGGTRTINKYDDVVIISDDTESVQKALKDYSSNIGWIFHLKQVPLLPDDVQLIHTRPDGVKIYANERAIRKSPPLVRSVGTNELETSGSIFVLHLCDHDGQEYVVFVKDRTKNYITNPAGSRDAGEEFRVCGIRECWEETSYRVPDDKHVLEIGSFECVIFFLFSSFISRSNKISGLGF